MDVTDRQGLLYKAAEVRILTVHTTVHGAQSGKRSISKLISVLTEEYTVLKTGAPKEMAQVGRGLALACMLVKVECGTVFGVHVL